jgi:predicted phosphodiesterase
MRYLLFSDVHANKPALEAVFRDARERGRLAGTYHLGDLVGYGPSPNDVIDMIRGRGIPGVAGNYDSTVATFYEHCGCRYEDPRQEALAHASYAWTLTHSSLTSKAYLLGLPFRIDVRPFGGHAAGPTIRLVHGNQVLSTVYVTEDRSDEFLISMGKSLGCRVGDVVCFGHTHLAWHRVVEGVHYVNTGSVGRPKDGDPRAGYVLVDVVESGVSVEFVRVSYDVEEVAKAIVASELPDELAEFLRTGGRVKAAVGGG